MISVSSLVFFQEPKSLHLEVGQNFHSPFLLTNPDNSLAAAASLLLSSCEMCPSDLSPDISANCDQVIIFRHEFFLQSIS